MTDYSDQIASNFEFLLRKNKIINGNFDIWQRNTTQTSSGYGSDDRWSNLSSGSTKTHSRQSFTLGQTDVPGEPAYYSRTVVSSSAGASNYVNKNQKIEGVRILAGQTATLSFYAKASSSLNIATELVQAFGTGGSPSSTVTSINVTTHSLTTSWQKFEVIINMPSISGKTIGSNSDDHIQVIFWFDAGSDFNSRTNSLGQQSGTFDIAKVQLEEGYTATKFEERSIGQELTLCQRYFEKITIPSTIYGIGIVRNGNTGTSMRGIIKNFKVEKRATPTGTETNSGQFAYVKCDTQVQTDGTAGNINVGGNTTMWYIYETVSGTNSDAYAVWAINSAPVFEFDSEL